MNGKKEQEEFECIFFKQEYETASCLEFNRQENVKELIISTKNVNFEYTL